MIFVRIQMIRKLKKDDDFKQVATLIYETDSIFRWLFGSRKKAIQRIERLISMENNSLSYKNIRCYFDGEICGILVSYEFDETNKKLENNDYEKAFSLLFILRIQLVYLVINKILTKNNSEFYIECLCVSDAHRKKGIGTKLIENILEDCKRKGFKFVNLDVNINNKNAINLYEKEGFIITKKKSIVGISTYSMCKNL